MIDQIKTIECPEDSAVLEGNFAVPEDFFLGRFLPLHYHYNLLLDRDRVEAFREAIGQVVRPGMKVLEMGGGTGILSFFAAETAEKVWCVERNPALVDASRQFLADNRHGDRVEVIEGDAMHYLPPEPVDVVICELLHAALLREKQLPVIQSFKDRYVRQFGDRLPRFIPEATFLAVEAVQQSFDFSGYRAPIPIFQAPASSHEGTESLAEPVIYKTICYEKPLPGELAWQATVTINRAGQLNALRFVTKNLLAILTDQQRAIEWWNQYLVLPISEPLSVEPGDAVKIAISYHPGGTIESLSDHIVVQSPSKVAA